jgi:predicted Zn-dependent peptidase
VQALTRDDLAQYAQRHYNGANVVVGAVGPLDVATLLRTCEQAFGALPAGTASVVDTPAYVGGVRTRSQAGSSQSHAVLGGMLGARRDATLDDEAATALAAAVLGEGMSSPLLHELREKRALAYHVSASADAYDMCGQFIIEASTAPERLDECLQAVLDLLRQHASAIDAPDLARARRPLAVRRLRALEKPLRRIEDAALDLFAHGRVRSHDERMGALHATPADAVRSVFEQLLGHGLSLAATGRLKRAAGHHAREWLAAARR